MRYLYAKFKGYIGFYNGMGLETVEIDFTKCKHNIILITGQNGVGKSTLMDALNPFPDPSSSFTPNQDAEKLLTLFDNGDTYCIRIISASDSKGGRKQSKAFISKNGMELNDNGNITSYREIIFSEFELDSNYATLSKLSGNDRGLGDKTPAERKKFASSIIDNLETYNDIYKTLNKKSLIFKSHTNTLHTKIQNIGTKDTLEITLNGLKQRNDAITSQIMVLNNKIVELQTRASINQEEMDNIQSLKSKEQDLNNQVSVIMNQLILLKKRTKIEFSDIESVYQSNIVLKEEYTKSRDEARVSWRSESDRLSRLVSSINELKANLEMYSTDIDTTLEERYNSSKNKIDLLSSQLNQSGVTTDTSLIYKLSNLIDFYIRFIKKIDSFYEGLTPENLKYIALLYNPSKLEELNAKLIFVLTEIEKNQATISDLRSKMNSIAILENRPDKCAVDTCPFISDALKTKNELGNRSIEDEIYELQESNLKLSNTSSKLQSDIENYSFCDRKRMELESIISDLDDQNELFVLFHDNVLGNKDNFLQALSNSSSFNLQRDPRKFIDSLNGLKELEYEIGTFKVLEVEYNTLKNKLEIIDKSTKSINTMEKELEEVQMKVASLKSSVDNYNDLITSIDSNLEFQKQYITLYQQYATLQIELNPIVEKINEIESKSSESVKGILHINEMKSEIARLTNESNPIVNDIQRISGQLTLLDSYYAEYELYKTKYNTIETLKKYCSPTGGGIQTIFMQLYMSKTLDLANQILGMLFGGEYHLLDFVINQNEFRIPFIGSGLAVDDISSGSTSQICIMGMAINLALFHQASTKFNIARLDEIDGGLDHHNKLEFFGTIYKAMPILEIEQLFAISHSMEADTSAVDIIKLKSYADSLGLNEVHEDGIFCGNIIYDYSEEVRKIQSKTLS